MAKNYNDFDEFYGFDEMDNKNKIHKFNSYKSGEGKKPQWRSDRRKAKQEKRLLQNKLENKYDN